MLLNRKSASGVCRLIVDPPAEGAWNMAVDEALVEAVAGNPMPTLRIYRWARPTLSLGYFQLYADRKSHPPSLAADVVRRLSGGGAILHDQEITYSLVLPTSHPLAADVQLLYSAVHQSIVKWLNSLFPAEGASWRLALCRTAPRKTRSESPPFLCFRRRSPGDVLFIDDVGPVDHKIVGSAQRRRRGSVLQHGSILWATSEAAPEMCGFIQLSGLKMSLDEAVDHLPSALLEGLQLEANIAALPAETERAAQKIFENRYKVPSWNERR